MKIINKYEEDEMEFYHDYKETNVRFPEHEDKEPSDVTIYNLSELVEIK